MAISARLLDDGERVVVSTRTHVKTLALVAVLGLAVRPFIGWLSTTHIVTNRRLTTRSGMLTRRGRDIASVEKVDLQFHSQLHRSSSGRGSGGSQGR